MMYKKMIMMALLVLTASYSFASDDQHLQLKKWLNRKIIFPEQLKITEKTSVEIQLEIMPDGCVAITASSGNETIINYIAEKISDFKLAYNQEGKNVFVYRFTFEKEHSNN